jgi:ssRNA-specific RNase YbeY (16S rRNA maturation enzyme)
VIARIHDQQSVLAVSGAGCRRLLAFLMRQAAATSPPDEWLAIDLTLSDDTGIAGCHERYFGAPTPTDVISQGYARVPGEEGNRGEIIVNVERARRLGPLYGGWQRELALYIAHGCDHLAGATDADPVGRRAMRRRELRWVEQAAEEGLLIVLPKRPRGRKSSTQ